jgi:hypothetical protein
VHRTYASTVLITCIFVFAPVSLLWGQTCTQTFTPSTIGGNGSNVNTAVTSGNAGTVLCFNSGTYGGITISGAHPSGNVTLRPAPSAAVAMGTFSVDNSSNILITGFGCAVGTWPCSANGSSSGGITTSGGGVSNLEFSYNAMNSNGAEIRDNSANANILLDHNNYVGFSAACETCRIHIFNNGTPSGVTVSYSLMSGGADDGIQWGGDGVRILNNEFTNLTGNGFGIHQDAMQGVGDSHSVIKGNYAHGVANCWQLTDGSSNLDMEDNVCVADGSDGHSGQICSQTLLFNHNTIASSYDINVGNDSNGSSSSNFTVTNNIFNGKLSVNNGQSVTGIFTQDFNLCYSGSGCSTGSHGVSGSPTYVGGNNPSAYAGFVLTSGSLGHNAASDGNDMGMNTNTVITGGPSAPTGLAAAVQ